MLPPVTMDWSPQRGAEEGGFKGAVGADEAEEVVRRGVEGLTPLTAWRSPKRTWRLCRGGAVGKFMGIVAGSLCRKPTYFAIRVGYFAVTLRAPKACEIAGFSLPGIKAASNALQNVAPTVYRFPQRYLYREFHRICLPLQPPLFLRSSCRTPTAKAPCPSTSQPPHRIPHAAILLPNAHQLRPPRPRRRLYGRMFRLRHVLHRATAAFDASDCTARGFLIFAFSLNRSPSPMKPPVPYAPETYTPHWAGRSDTSPGSKFQ